MNSKHSSKPRVLVVDDTPENIHILMAFLRHSCEVTAATNGPKALECARSSARPDLILLDVVMPGMSGYQVCESLKSDPLTADIPIIFVTGMSDETDEEKGLKLGAADYISKPFRAGVVRARVKHQLELKLFRDTPNIGSQVPSHTLPLLESALSRSIRTPYLRCDSRGLILACSPALCEILGLIQHTLGRDLWQLLPSTHAAPLKEALAGLREGARSFSWKLPARDALDFQLAVDCDGFLLLGEHLDQQVIDAVCDRWIIQEASRLKTEFLANLSHEIRSPLNAISGMAHLMSETALNPQQLTYLRDLETGVKELKGVVAELSSFSDTDLASLELRNGEFKLRSVVDGVLLQLAAQAQRKEVELVSRTAQDVPALVWGDSLRLGQLLFALVENGVKFAAGGRVSLSVDVLNDEQLQFKILDSGIGMTQEQLNGLLGGGFLANAGMGIPMSRRIVERMEGGLRLESQPGQGTLVTIALPLLRETRAGQAPQLRSGGPGARVLLVEDSEVNQRIVVEMLGRAGIGVDVAGNGRIAVAKLLECEQEIPWRVILMDLQMPEMDGYAATRRIRRESRFNQIPILAMSSHVLGEERERCREAGMDDFVFKPVDRQSWFQTLGRWLPLEDDLQSRSFPPLTQINSASGMRSCGGNQQFYRSLLLDFADRCRQSAWELEAALAIGDQSRVRFLVHTLHGVAANLGAEELARQCQNLQEQSEHPPGSAISTLVTHLRLLAETLPNELSSESRIKPAEEWTVERMQATRAALNALSQQLQQGLGDSLDSMQDLISVATPLNGQLEQLERLVNQFNFSGALQELEKLESSLPFR
jgi:CheY-like chemotaxis protein/HPt (histidine-containing phosphotransfer) domain-containing protein